MFTQELPEWLTAQEAADFLRVHLRTIYRWLNEGKMQGLKVGPLWRVHRGEAQRIFKDPFAYEGEFEKTG